MFPESSITNNYDTFVTWVVNNVAENPKVSAYALPSASAIAKLQAK